ncbi:hypothetical protein EDD18DRAFT_1461192 [Armillaria luteobubalina]|uniref:Uncharacterized protein n=1 Tax=Armillaria luteobubalina TaxID=153913 RepID=A0AA39Q9N3_9AGAR|nr:hypothetical protein EDD18DRAFT_1461192 [Armillaria luteobubalina]
MPHAVATDNNGKSNRYLLVTYHHHEMDSQSSTSSRNSTQYTHSEQSSYDPDLAADLQSRIFVPPDALLTTLLRLPKDWRTNAAARWVIDVIRRDDAFQATIKGYIQASNGTGELDVSPCRLYDGMLLRVLELTHADEMRLSQCRSHFLEFAARDEWLDTKQGLQKRTSSKDEDDHDNVSDDDDGEPYDDEKESEVVANRQRMSIRCASMAKDMLSMLRSHSLGLLISPRKAQILYYDRSAIVISEAFDILDSDDQPTDTLIVMLLGFSIIPPNSGVPPIFSHE